MTRLDAPSPAELPSPARLRFYAIGVLLVAALLAVTVVLPAERGVDPTGIGARIGLKEMGEIKIDLEEELRADSLAR